MVDVLTLDDLDSIPAQELQARARTTYLANLELGYRMTGAELGKMYKRSARWGRLQIAAVTPTDEPSPALPDTEPALPPNWTPPAEEPQASAPEPSLPPVVTPPAEPEPAPVAAVTERHEEDPAAVAATLNPISPLRIWPVWLLMLPAAVAIWSGWVGLGQMAGFGPVQLLPGIADQVIIDSSITLPIGMETYAAYALYVWLSGKARGRARKMARNSAIAAMAVGALGQIAYHVMAAANIGTAPWWITAGVACLPVAVLGMGAALAHMVRAEADGPRGSSAQAAIVEG
jgi:hypothetical protein